MKNILSIIILLLSIICQAQKTEKFNLGFEKQKTIIGLSDGWFTWGNYDLSIDKIAHSGKRSGKITSTINGNFGSIAYKIPANYTGKKIKLEGYIKIQNVRSGFAGLLMRIDGEGGSLAFENMKDQNISGTKDWQKYSITLDFPESAELIFVAGILTGKEEAWFDDFVVTIDGKDIQTLKEIEKELSKSKMDKEFINGSLLNLSNVSADDIQDLELLGRIWGFLKYHHPEIAKGNYNWDFELFRFLPKYLETTNEKKRNLLLIGWIDSLGELKKCSKCKPIDKNAVHKPDLKWIEAQEENLQNKLIHVYKNRAQGDHYYISMAPGVGNPQFKNENDYANMKYPDDGFRLLSLYRYWNMINYFFPYKHLMDEDWNTKLKEYIPAFLDAKNELEYELAVIQIIGDIQDCHANLWNGGDKINEWKGVNCPPIHLRFIENQLVVADYYNEELKEEVGLEIGDVITQINGIPVETLVKEKLKVYPASNLTSKLRDISADLLRSNSNQIEIEYYSANATLQKKSLKLYPKDSLNIYIAYRSNPDEKSYKIIENNIGYITLSSIKAEDIKHIKEEFIDTKGIIIDIRNYPSTFVPFSLGSYFVTSTTPFVKFTTADTDHPGEFKFTKTISISRKGKTYKGPVVVLLNELSQSQAEYTAMAFKAGVNTTIIGSATAGADGNVSAIRLPGGLSTMISGIGVYYPNGEETQRIGIVPDIEVNPTIIGIRADKDELMEKAIKFINSK